MLRIGARKRRASETQFRPSASAVSPERRGASGSFLEEPRESENLADLAPSASEPGRDDEGGPSSASREHEVSAASIAYLCNYPSAGLYYHSNPGRVPREKSWSSFECTAIPCFGEFNGKPRHAIAMFFLARERQYGDADLGAACPGRRREQRHLSERTERPATEPTRLSIFLRPCLLSVQLIVSSKSREKDTPPERSWIILENDETRLAAKR
ncbi:hypothetical protein KM043_008901 [Ampulex compressa]|nr:hypothetical protein KM043_008901 [Ampulex compressa]